MTAVALLGHGGWGRNHAKVLRQLGVLSCIIDQGDSASRDDSETPWFDSLDQAVEMVHFDAAVVATPAPSHELLASRLISLKKHVLVEKPVAFSLDGLTKLYRSADDQGLVLMSGHLLQYHPALMTMRAEIDSGKIGKVRFASSVRSSLGKVRTHEDVLWSFAPHDVGLILTAFGGYPLSVSARQVDVLGRGVPDAGFISMQYLGGRFGLVQVNWLSPVKEQRLTVVGDAGSLTFNDQIPRATKLALAQYGISNKEDAPPSGSILPLASDLSTLSVDGGPPLDREIVHFLAAIRGKNNVADDRWLALGITEILDLASASAARDGEIIELGR